VDPNLPFVPVCILANKQDIEGAIGDKIVKELFGLNEITDRDWFVVPTSFVGEMKDHKGFFDCIEWVENSMNSKDHKQRAIWKKEHKEIDEI